MYETAALLLELSIYVYQKGGGIKQLNQGTEMDGKKNREKKDEDE